MEITWIKHNVEINTFVLFRGWADSDTLLGQNIVLRTSITDISQIKHGMLCCKYSVKIEQIVYYL